MDSNELDDLSAHAKVVATMLARAYRDVTGEEFQLESAIRHYPLVALGLAAGAGAVGGWWLARRSKPQLPPPKPSSAADALFGSLRELGSRLSKDRQHDTGQQPLRSYDYLERLFPEGFALVRRALPELKPEEAAELATVWIDTFLQPRLKQGLESVRSNVMDGGFGGYLKQRRQRPAPDEQNGPEGEGTPQAP